MESGSENGDEKLKKQFRDTQRVPLMLDKTRQPLSARLETKKNILLEKSTKNPKKSSMLAKRSISSRSRRGFDENKLEKVA